MVGIGIVVLKGESVLLVRRGKPPAAGTWSIPGGAQEVGETAEAAARRELAEEAGLSVGPLVLAANVDSIHRDDAGRVRFHYTILDFAAAWVAGEPRAGGDVSDAVFAPIGELAGYSLWSEAHRVIGLAQAVLAEAGSAPAPSGGGRLAAVEGHRQSGTDHPEARGQQP